MKFSLMSDLHIDFPQNRIPYDKLERLVVVAGDTANGLLGFKFLDGLKNRGFEVISCDGNHEHYSNLPQKRSPDETSARFREKFPSTGETSEGVPFFSTNGWYRVTSDLMWKSMMNDSVACNLSYEEVNEKAKRSAGLAQKVFEEWRNSHHKGIVVTHTSPCEETLDPKYSGSASNEWYWNPYMRDLLSEYSDQILVWCHGHTHARNEAVVDGVRVICNPRGYPGENPGWSPLTVVV